MIFNARGILGVACTGTLDYRERAKVITDIKEGKLQLLLQKSHTDRFLWMALTASVA